MDYYQNNDLITTKKSNKVSQDKMFSKHVIFENLLLLVLQFAGVSKNGAISTSGKILFVSVTSKLQNIKIDL